MKVRNVEFIRAQLGWRCEITFSTTTAGQFTDEWFTAEGSCHGHGIFSALLAWRRAVRQAKSLEKLHRPRPGERRAKGWAG